MKQAIEFLEKRLNNLESELRSWEDDWGTDNIEPRYQQEVITSDLNSRIEEVFFLIEQLKSHP